MANLIAVVAVAFNNGSVGRMQLFERDVSPLPFSLPSLLPPIPFVEGEDEDANKIGQAEYDAAKAAYDDEMARWDAIVSAYDARIAAAAIWTDEDIQAEVDASAVTWAALGLVASGWHRCTLDDFPTDHHDFRAAWTVEDGKIVVDIDKARAVTKDRLRAERAPIFAAKDLELMRAVEADDKNTTALIATQKQWLRDVTALPEIAAATTLDDLRAISATIPDTVAPEHRLVSKRVIVDRLEAAGKLAQARAAIDASDVYTQERWNTRSDIYADDPTALALCQAIGADPAVIFAP